eukprot:1765386-Alexandrium_andersonii.AAC.1
MSASLVGSEMCIRDRIGHEQKWKDISGRAQTTAEACRNLQETASSVSYTHLTLPTICSV